VAVLGLVGIFDYVYATAPSDESESSEINYGEVPLFSGGMLFHFVPFRVTLNNTSIHDLGMGVGGRLHFYLFDYLRIGGMGGLTKMRYGIFHSKFEAGHGGLTIDGCYRWNRVEVALGVLIGGMGITVYHFARLVGEETYEVQYIKERFFIITPMLSVDVKLTQRIKVTASTQFHFGYFSDFFFRNTMQTYVGILFNH